MPRSSDLEGIHESITELKVAQTKMEGRLDLFDEKINHLDSNVTTVKDSLGEACETMQKIHDRVIERSIDISWIKKVVMIVLTAIIGSGALGVGVYKAVGDGVSSEVVKEVAANGLDKHRSEAGGSNREHP